MPCLIWMDIFGNPYDANSSWPPGILTLLNLAPIQKGLDTPDQWSLGPYEPETLGKLPIFSHHIQNSKGGYKIRTFIKHPTLSGKFFHSQMQMHGDTTFVSGF